MVEELQFRPHESSMVSLEQRLEQSLKLGVPVEEEAPAVGEIVAWRQRMVRSADVSIVLHLTP
jgi:hypothetical protein